MEIDKYRIWDSRNLRYGIETAGETYKTVTLAKSSISYIDDFAKGILGDKINDNVEKEYHWEYD